MSENPNTESNDANILPPEDQAPHDNCDDCGNPDCGEMSMMLAALRLRIRIDEEEERDGQGDGLYINVKDLHGALIALMDKQERALSGDDMGGMQAMAAHFLTQGQHALVHNVGQLIGYSLANPDSQVPDHLPEDWA